MVIRFNNSRIPWIRQMMSQGVSPVIGPLVVLLVMCFPVAIGNHDARRLYDDILLKSKYNRLVRPAIQDTDAVRVKLGIKLSQLIGIDEKNQIMSLSMWLFHEWVDHSLKWDPRAYGDVRSIYVPSESIWLPDVILYNNADGDYTVTLMTKAELNYDGRVTWEPPVIFKSYCEMDMQYFPFDEQLCKLKFGSWTYDGLKVDMRHLWKGENMNETAIIQQGIDLRDFYANAEWDIMSVPARKNNIFYPCCPKEPYPDITFNITLRRKTLYFAYSLIVPCISINMLTILTFYLPSDSGEKMSLCVSILLSLSIFQWLLFEIIPATSITVPLFAQYILFTMVVVSLSIVISVITLNVNFRSSSTTELPDLTKKIFLEILPRLLFMGRPKYEDNVEHPDFPEESCTDLTWGNPYLGRAEAGEESNVNDLVGHYDVASTFIGAPPNINDFCYACAKRKVSGSYYPPSAKKALEGCVFVAKHLQDEDDGNKVKQEWLYLALVVDRIMLYIFMSVMIVTTMGIILNAPSLYSGESPMNTKAV